MVNDMLDYVKLDSGQLKLVINSFRIRDLLFGCTDILGVAALNHGVEFKIYQPYTEKMSCEGDIQRIRQIVVNILSNAVKFSKPNHFIEIRIQHRSEKPELKPSNPRYHYYSPTPAKIETKGLSSPNDIFFLYIQIADTGCGIASDRLSQVFDKLNRGSHQSARRYDGAGFGLGVCKKLSDLMGGQLMVESKENVGTVFHIAIPLSYEAKYDDFKGITNEEKDMLLQFQPDMNSPAQWRSNLAPTLQLN